MLGRLIASASLLLILTGLFAPRTAMAQEEESPATFQDATGFMWGLATFELSLALSMGILAATEVLEDDEEAALPALIGTVAAVLGLTAAAGVAAGNNDTPADVPFVVHNALTAGMTGFLLGGSVTDLAGESGDEAMGAAFVIGVAAIMGFSTYATLRRSHLIRDPDAAAGAHLMTWSQPAVSLLTLALAAAFEMDDDLLPLAAALSGLLTFGVGIGLAEAGT